MEYLTFAQLLHLIVVLITDTTVLSCLSTACVTILYGCYRASELKLLASLVQHNNGNGSRNASRLHGINELLIEASHGSAIELSTAIMFPLLASVSLLVMFYFFGALAPIFQLITILGAMFAVGFLILPFAEAVSNVIRKWWHGTAHYARTSSSSVGTTAPGNITATGSSNDSNNSGNMTSLNTVDFVVSGAIVVLVILSWMITGHWMLNNLIGVALCILFICIVRLPNLKVATVLLCGLFVYDVFWVFFSSRFFGKNVMVTIATQESANPIAAISEKMGWHLFPVKVLPLPTKLMFPVERNGHHGYSMLGLGDIVVPGIFLSFVYGYENGISQNRMSLLSASSPRSTSWPVLIWSRLNTVFARAMLGYVCGLLTSFFCNILFSAPQPALLYLVPMTLFPVYSMALQRKEFRQMWNFEQSGLSPDQSTQTMGSASFRELVDDGQP